MTTVTQSAQAHRAARWWTAGAGVVCALVGWAVVGTDGLLAGVVATVLVLAFMAAGLLPLAMMTDGKTAPGTATAVLFLTHLLRLGFAIGALALLAGVDAIDTRWLGATVVVTALTWSAVHLIGVVRASKREQTVVPETSDTDAV